MTETSAFTPATGWRKHVPVTLPSGSTVLLRPFDIGVVLRWKDMPDTLRPAVADLMGEAKRKPADPVEDSIRFAAVLEVVCRTMFVSPRIVDAPAAENEISINDVEWRDQQYVMSLVNKGAEELRSFRPEPAPHVDGVDNEQGQPREAE